MKNTTNKDYTINNSQLYNIIDNNTVRIKNKSFTKKQIKTNKNLFLFLGIIFILLGIAFIPIIIIGILFLYMFYTYDKIYKELNKSG